MGIDIYLKWGLMTEEDCDAQVTGFDTTKGEVGYLREAYHGEPYPSKILMPETFEIDAGMDGIHIPVATLRERLSATIEAAIERETKIYNEVDVTADSPVPSSYRRFVEKAEALEAEGHHVLIVNSY